MFNQLSGINAILYYLNDIFAFAGFNKVSSDLQAVTIGATNLVFTMLAILKPKACLSRRCRRDSGSLELITAAHCSVNRCIRPWPSFLLNRCTIAPFSKPGRGSSGGQCRYCLGYSHE